MRQRIGNNLNKTCIPLTYNIAKAGLDTKNFKLRHATSSGFTLNTNDIKGLCSNHNKLLYKVIEIYVGRTHKL